jgi:phosphoglycolate phosphatase
MTRAAAILFDLDGTLIDTAPDMIDALNRLRAEHGREPLPFTEARAHVSHGAMRLTRIGFPEAEGEAFERLRLRFLDLYAERLADGSSLFPGFDAMLAHFESDGLPWGVVTNKPAWLTDPLLERLKLFSRAACVVSGDTVAERKPHPLPLLHAAALARVDPARCVYVGDAERDVIAGRAAGMRTVVAAYGYLGPDDDPLTWHPDGVVERPEQILDWIDLPAQALRA